MLVCSCRANNFSLIEDINMYNLNQQKQSFSQSILIFDLNNAKKANQNTISN